MVATTTKAAVAVSILLLGTDARCPGGMKGTPPLGHAPVPTIAEYNTALENLVVDDVLKDIEAAMTDSQQCWPADYDNYGPFWIRMAWHCSGTYRQTDGRGGCGGGRQRFDPEASWEDNGNLEHARALLVPIKEKYGDGLSWGDLILAAGTLAIEKMGGPVEQYCFGRLDDPDGTASLDLGPTSHQEAYAPCPKPGHCKEPLGTDTLGLIYVNPEGPAGEDGKPVADPVESSKHIRDVFGRMGMNDTETVALIGGGHAFGKVHGACPAGNGECGYGEMKGKGRWTYTSGFEGPWTTTPTQWSNEFFRYTEDKTWEVFTGPGGRKQWKIKDAPKEDFGLMRLTSDIALIKDDIYKGIVHQFATDQSALDKMFAHSWNKLVTNGGRWAENKKCQAGNYGKQLLI